MENKTFTQEQVDKIVQDRLARAHTDLSKQLGDLTQEVDRYRQQEDNRIHEAQRVGYESVCVARGLDVSILDKLKFENEAELLQVLDLLPKEAGKQATGLKQGLPAIDGNDSKLRGVFGL